MTQKKKAAGALRTLTTATNEHAPSVATTEPASNATGREANVIAKMAAKGIAVHRLSGGGFLACQWGFARHCVDLASLVAFARQVGVL